MSAAPPPRDRPRRRPPLEIRIELVGADDEAAASGRRLHDMVARIAARIMRERAVGDIEMPY